MATGRSRSPGQGSEIAVAVMLPPSEPALRSQLSISGSLGKRKRGQESAAGSIGAVTSASYGFAPSVKEKVERLNGGFQCWHCSAPKSQICHVIGRRERVVRGNTKVVGYSAIADRTQLFQELQSQGRLSIQHLDQAENAIPLCALCHDALDEISSPGWVFIPTGIQYFLDFERRDYKRRRGIHELSGAYAVRVSPSPGQYLQHQRQDVEEDSQGGLYACYVLRHYMGRIPGIAELQPGLSPYTKPKPWHGDPMAALSKAFKALGIKPLAFPAALRDKLMELLLLYDTNDQLLKHRPYQQSAMDSGEGPGPSPSVRTNEEAGPQSKIVTRRNGTHTRQRTPSTPRGRRGASHGHQVQSNLLKRKRSPEGAREGTKTPPSDIQERRKRPLPEAHWKWGPEATSEMAVKFYDSVYHIPHNGMAPTVEVKERSDKAHRETLLPSPRSSEDVDSADRPPTPRSPDSPSTPFHKGLASSFFARTSKVRKESRLVHRCGQVKYEKELG